MFVKKIFRYIWPQIRKYKTAFYLIITLYTLRMISGVILTGFYFKKIIDVISSPGTDHTLFRGTLFWLIFLIICLHLLAVLLARSGKFLYFTFQTNVIRELRNFSFQKIEQNSHTFFANTFAGSLVTKSRRFVGAFENMFDVFIYDFLIFFVILAGVSIVLYRESAVISLIFFIWIVLHITV